jgi:hypothetical protein
MDQPNPSNELFEPAPSVSLLGRFGARMRDAVGDKVNRSAPARVTGWLILLAIGMAAGVTMLGALRQARLARADAQAFQLQGEATGRDRERADAIGRALARPPLDSTLALLRAHLPPGIRLIEAARGADGVLSVAIDTPDPDALRAALTADSRLMRFRERGQETREDGMIRVRLAGEIG